MFNCKLAIWLIMRLVWIKEEDPTLICWTVQTNGFLNDFSIWSFFPPLFRMNTIRLVSPFLFSSFQWYEVHFILRHCLCRFIGFIHFQYEKGDWINADDVQAFGYYTKYYFFWHDKIWQNEWKKRGSIRKGCLRTIGNLILTQKLDVGIETMRIRGYQDTGKCGKSCF